ncbi:LOW QUALITY PROTEIN: anthrachelin biosynthesis protein AsbA [Bacillus sp. JCM 19047]|nr:LOW QUALITY PROTEIN: anthrachelin biosynthesis protein AsbA [Bacillus sp. JCM 19047]
MQHSAKRIAENASLQAFLNSYIKETLSGELLPVSINGQSRHKTKLQTEQMLEINLPHQHTSLRIEMLYRSFVGRHSFGIILKGNRETGWHQEEPLSVLILLIQELHLQALHNGDAKRSCFDECLVRMLESYHSMCTYLEERLATDEAIHDPRQTFIDAEQSLLFGHWLHPTPKSRQGMAYWQHAAYAPELKGQFQLYYFYVHHTILQHESMLDKSVWDIVYEETDLQMIDEKWFPFPMHPLQAQFLLEQPHIRKAMETGLIQDKGPCGKWYTATSSLRTVFNEESNWMFKFSIPVKVTNSLRVNKRHELRLVLLLEKYYKEQDGKSKTCQFIDDPAYLTVRLPGVKESGFETIVRSNPFQNGGRGVTTIAALVQDPLPGSDSKVATIIKELAQQERSSLRMISEKWFRTYVESAIVPLISLYDELGIALEAHQQNSLLDVQNGYPTMYYYRDNQGYYLAESYRQKLTALVPELQKTEGLFYDDDVIQNRFTYYLMMNQAFAVIHRFGADGLMCEKQLLKVLKEALKHCSRKCSGAGRLFINDLLVKTELAFKANLLTRFHDVDELAEELEQAVYVKVQNPFQAMTSLEVQHAKTI